MALDSYTDLVATVGRWLRRTDLTGDIPDFIAMAEAQMNRRLRVRQMVQRATPNGGVVNYAGAPGDFLVPISFFVNDATGNLINALEYVTPQRATQMNNRFPSPGEPLYYTIINGAFRYLPAPDQAYTAEITYFRTIPALSADEPTNWLLATYPDAYLYGTLLQSAPFLKADDRLTTWAQLFQSVLTDIEAADAVPNTTTLVADPGLISWRRQRRFNINAGY